MKMMQPTGEPYGARVLDEKLFVSEEALLAHATFGFEFQRTCDPIAFLSGISFLTIITMHSATLLKDDPG
jgi:hypothetical protein